MIEITNELVSVVSAQLEDVTDAQVNRVLTAFNAIYEGPPVGTIIQNAETGEVAHRVSESGVIIWRVTKTNGEAWGSHTPTLPGTWTNLYSPPEPDPVPTDPPAA